MPKAKIALPNGTVVEIEGDEMEIKNLLAFYAPQTAIPVKPIAKKTRKAKKVVVASAKSTNVKESDSGGKDISEIVNLVKTCDEAEAIETQILDRTSEVNRVLLPLYIVSQYMNNAFGLTTVEVAAITTELGIRVFRQNALRVLTSSGSRYVLGDKVRKPGQATHYVLNRRGIQYMKEIIQGGTDA